MMNWPWTMHCGRSRPDAIRADARNAVGHPLGSKQRGTDTRYGTYSYSPWATVVRLPQLVVVEPVGLHPVETISSATTHPWPGTLGWGGIVGTGVGVVVGVGVRVGVGVGVRVGVWVRLAVACVCGDAGDVAVVVSGRIEPATRVMASRINKTAYR
jgi:hypothetical protein